MGSEPNTAFCLPSLFFSHCHFFFLSKDQMLEQLWFAAWRQWHSVTVTTWLRILYSTVHDPSSKKRDFGLLIGGGRAGSWGQNIMKLWANCQGLLSCLQWEVALTWWGWHDLWLAEATHRLHTHETGLVNQKCWFTQLFPSWKQVLVTQIDNAWTWHCSYQTFDLIPPHILHTPPLFFRIFTLNSEMTPRELPGHIPRMENF